MLPPEVLELHSEKNYQAAWLKHGQQQPTGSDPAATEMIGFLRMNGFQGPEPVEWVQQQQGRQYCEADPRFCPKEERSLALGGTKSRLKPTSPRVLAWSRHVWQFANLALGNDVTDPVGRTKFIIEALTGMINSPHIGCADCAKHWRKNLADYPTTDVATLQQAREWLVKIHNAASPHTPAMTIEDVAKEAGWTLEVPRITPMNPLEQFEADLKAKLAVMTPGDLRAVFERAGVEFVDPADYVPEAANDTLNAA